MQLLGTASSVPSSSWSGSRSINSTSPEKVLNINADTEFTFNL